jgi:hypothetical protein
LALSQIIISGATHRRVPSVESCQGDMGASFEQIALREKLQAIGHEADEQ